MHRNVGLDQAQDALRVATLQSGFRGFAILGQSGQKTDVLVGVVKKTALREHLDLLAAAGIDPRVVTLAPLALSALGERGVLAPEGTAPLTVALLDAGPDRADLALLDAG